MRGCDRASRDPIVSRRFDDFKEEAQIIVESVTEAQARIAREAELRHTSSFANYAQCIFAGDNSVNDFFRNKWSTSGNLFARTRH